MMTPDRLTELERKVAELEKEMARLKMELADLTPYELMTRAEVSALVERRRREYGLATPLTPAGPVEAAPRGIE